MAGLFGGYGLPLNGLMPAALNGVAGVYALADENTRPGPNDAVAEAAPPAPEEVLVDDGLVKAIGGRTWCGVEYGVAPGYAHSFFEYVDAIRRGDLDDFVAIEAATADWWFPTLDRGAGAALHIAVDHGQLEAVRFLLNARGAEVNQQDRERGWTPLHRAARMAHSRAEPYLEIFELLLQHGADASILSYEGWEELRSGRFGVPQSVFDVCTDAGLGWKPGRLRRLLRALVAKYAHVPKARPFRYEGPPVGAAGLSLMKQWAALEEEAALAALGANKDAEGNAKPSRFLAPPDNWVAPMGAGFQGAEGAQPLARRAWRRAGTEDESYFERPMTQQELLQQEKDTLARAKAVFDAGGVQADEARMF